MKWTIAAKKFLRALWDSLWAEPADQAKDQAVQPTPITKKEPTSLLDSFDDFYEEGMYKIIRKEIDADPHTRWGKDFHALIISDRCAGRAIGLCEYLKARTDLKVLIRDNARSIQKTIELRAPDIVIFVGYQENKENYDILTAQQGQRPYLVVMYACVDNMIQSECAQYGIPLMYHCKEPTAGFVGVLMENLK